MSLQLFRRSGIDNCEQLTIVQEYFAVECLHIREQARLKRP